jgi:hypothetical protein
MSLSSVVQEMPTGTFLVFLAVPLGMAGIAVFASVRAKSRLALMKATPKENLAFATDGYREFEGRAGGIGGASLRAPLTGAECLWYHAKVEHFERIGSSGADGDHRSDWVTVREVTSTAPFLVTDATGTAVVFPNRGEVTPTDKSLWHGADVEPSDRNPPRKGPGESTTPMFEVAGTPNAHYRYFEERIYLGDPLYVVGDFMSGPWVADDDDEEGEEGEEETSATGEETSATGDVEAPGDPWDDYDGLEAMERKAREVTTRRVRRLAKKPLLISTTPQGKLMEMYQGGWKAALGVAVVPLAIAGFLLWLRFGG